MSIVFDNAIEVVHHDGAPFAAMAAQRPVEMYAEAVRVVQSSTFNVAHDEDAAEYWKGFCKPCLRKIGVVQSG